MNVIEDNQIEEIANTLWSTLFDLDTQSVAYSLPVQQPLVYGAYVTISGGFSGGVIVQTSYDHLRSLAAKSFEKELADVSAHEMDDLMKELSNIIGGQIKAVLPGDCQLSLPSVEDNLKGEWLLPGMQILQNVHIKSEGESIHIRLAQCV